MKVMKNLRGVEYIKYFFFRSGMMNFFFYFQYRLEIQCVGFDYNNYSKIGDGVQMVFLFFVYLLKVCYLYSFGFFGFCEFYQLSVV